MEDSLRAAYPYQAYYCEENIYKLCEARRSPSAWAVLIRAEGPAFPALAQRAAAPGEPILWDYHVIYAESHLVYDFDSTLSFPAPVALYFKRTFFAEDDVPRPMRPLFRAVPAGEYLETFSSDRSHMKDGVGDWIQPPPPWGPIGAGNELPALLDLRRGLWRGLEGVRTLLTRD